jgi:hypothetical protein
VSAVVAILKIFGENVNNSRNAYPKKFLNKPNKWLNSKEKALNRPKKHLKGLHESIDDASKGILVVKQKTIRVLLDTGMSGDLLFIKKGSQKNIPDHEEGYRTVVGYFK